MRNLSAHIAYLLMYHDCVILPDFGAFVVYETNADRVGGDNLFFPPVRSIGFNQGLKHNDGLLSGLIMKELQLSFQEASIIVVQFCEELKEKLQQQQQYVIPSVGTLRLSDTDHILFSEDYIPSSNACHYGLDMISMPRLHRHVLSSQDSERQKEVVLRSLGERWLHATRVIAASAAVFMLCATPIGKLDNANEAGFIASSSVEMSQSVVELKISDICLDVYMPPILEPTQPIVVEQELVAVEKKIAPNHYVIVGSFPTRAVAMENIRKMKFKSNYKPAVLSCDGRHRIYVQTFQSKSDAERFLSNFRSTYTKYSDAWIYSAKK